MKYKKFGNQWIVRIDRGEEIIEELKRFCRECAVRLGSVRGIGATNQARVGLFRTGSREYVTMEVRGDHEIVSLLGNISLMNGETYLHLHITLTDESYRALGGHLNAAVVSGTCEVVIDELSGEMEREFDAEVGLNLYRF